MATPQQIELAKKYGYTQEQINQEMATPGTVKRSATLGTPVYEQPVNNQYASAGTTPPIPTTDTPYVEQNILSPSVVGGTTPVAPTPVPTNIPATGSVGSILGEGFGAEDPFIQQYTQDQLNQYNQKIDPQAAYNEQLAQRQAQIDATNALYRDQLNQARIQGQGRLGSGRAIQARGGLLGSSFGAAQTNQIQSANTDIENSIEQERLAAVNAIMTQARDSAAADIREKRLAKEAGGKAYLDYLSGASTRKQEKVSKAAQLLLSLGKSPQDISDAELKQAGISRQDLTMEYTAGKSAQDAANAKAQAEQQKTSLENAKTEAEINQIYGAIAKAQAEGSKYYEVGNKIYELGTNKFISDAVFNPYSQFQVTQGNQVFDPKTGTFTAPPTSGFRTDRHNNPTAMTTDVARSLGLVEGVDYVAGDSFPDNPNLRTAKFLGDGIQTTIKALDAAANDPNKSAFTTQGGQPRWTYINMSDQQWQSLNPEQKVQVINQMYQNEGGSGTLGGGQGGIAQYDPIKGPQYEQYNSKGVVPKGVDANTFKQEALAYKKESIGRESTKYLDSIDKLLNTPISRKERIAINTAPSLASLSGGYADILNAFNNIISKLNIKSLTDAKAQGATFGQLSNQELKVLGDAATSLKLNSSDEEWKRQIAIIGNALLQASGQPPRYSATGTSTTTPNTPAPTTSTNSWTDPSTGVTYKF